MSESVPIHNLIQIYDPLKPKGDEWLPEYLTTTTNRYRSPTPVSCKYIAPKGVRWTTFDPKTRTVKLWALDVYPMDFVSKRPAKEQPPRLIKIVQGE